MNTSINYRLLRPGLAAALGAGALVWLAGCSSEPESHVVSTPPPAVAVAPVVAQQVPVVTQTVPVATVPAQVVATSTPAGTVVLNQAMPVAPQIVVTRPARPSDYDVWVDGHWTYRHNQYEWINGHWEVPPSQGEVWIQPQTEQRSDGYYTFIEGHWSVN